MLSLALLLVASSARGLPAVEVEAESAGQSSALLRRMGSLDLPALPEGLAAAAGSPVAEPGPADEVGTGPLGTLGVPAPVPTSALALGSRAWRQGLQQRRPAAATPQADVDLQRWAAEARRRGGALHRHHEEALQEDRHLRAEDARLRREAAALRAAVASQASPTAAPTASPGTSHLSSGAIFLLVCLALLILGCCTWAGVQTYGDLHHHAGDGKGDGTVSSADVKAALHRHFLCGLDGHSLRSLCQLLAFAIAGFVFLWWKEMIQPILQNLIVIAYIATVVLLILGIVGGEAFSDFSDRLTQAHEAAKRVEHVFHQGTNDVDEHT